jgi:dihydroneopterin aldolase
MQDKLFIHGLEIPCIIGTLPRERKKKQPVVIDLEFPAPVRKAAKRDDLKDALNYKKIAERVTAFTSLGRFYLIETLAERLARMLLREFKLRNILLRISKPNAVRNAKSVGVEIFRHHDFL